MARTIGFDLDGVLARPALYSINFASALDRPDNRAWEPPAPGFGTALRAIFSKTPVRDEGEVKPESPATGAEASGLRKTTERIRYALRFPMPDAKDILSGLQRDADLVLVTNRNAANRPQLERWLQSKGLARYLSGVHLNESGEPGTHFKLRKLRELGIDEYVEDNPEICEHLSDNGVTVYFRRWGFVRMPRGDGIVPFRSAAELFAAVRSTGPGAGR